ncbi:hypothetical protein A2U01_0057652, partial [Trifolium medium]|nr:hypothetical protein [Trifolium medium]
MSERVREIKGCWRGAQARPQEAGLVLDFAQRAALDGATRGLGVQVWLWPLSFVRRAGRLAQRASAMLIYKLSAFLL